MRATSAGPEGEVCSLQPGPASGRDADQAVPTHSQHWASPVSLARRHHHSQGIKLLARAPELNISMSAEDGQKYGVADGEWISLKSRRGVLEGRVLYTDKMRTGEVFVPFVKLQEHAANFLTSDALDPFSGIPEYKVCAVRIEKVEEPAHSAD